MSVSAINRFRGSATCRSVQTALFILTCVAGVPRLAHAQQPFWGNPVDLPGTVQAEDYDNGGQGVAYWDSTWGNAGGAYRSDDVDIEPSSNGGYDVGWTAPGEWLNYTVNVTSDGSYNVQLQVASMGGGEVHVGFNGPSTGTWSAVSIPDTGGWQNWTTVNVPVTLHAGWQQMTILFDTGAVNVDSIQADGGGDSSASASNYGGGSGSGSSGGSGADPVVVTWNIDSVESWAGGSDHAAAAMDYILGMSPQPQIIVLQEALRSQFNTYLGELQGRTGQSWSGVFAQHCSPGSWTGSWCTDNQDEGVAVLTSLPMQDSSTTYLPFADDWHSARAVARAAIDIGGRTVQVFGAHMSNTSDVRYNEMQALIGWAQGFSSPQMVAGDFNADPDQIDQGWAMGGAFADAWAAVGSGAGYTANTPDPTMHLDYWFTDYSGLIQPQWATVETGPGTFSDHYAVRAQFVVY